MSMYLSQHCEIAGYGGSAWEAARGVLQKRILFCKTAVSSLKVKCSVSRLSHWFMDSLALSIQMSNVIILAMVKAIKMNGVSCCLIGNVERSSRSEKGGYCGMLRISGGLFMTSEQTDRADEPSQRVIACFPFNPCGVLCGWWWCAGFYIPQGVN